MRNDEDPDDGLKKLAEESGLVRIVRLKAVGALPPGTVWWVKPETAQALRAAGEIE